MLFSIVMGGNLTRSIVLLEKAVRRLAEGDLESQVDIRGSDEIRALGRSFDQLRQSLKEESARQSRFVMGVSHDLKSPLALVKGYVELLRDGPVPPEARQAHFDLILDKTDQLDDMIDHLIDYGKVNTGDWQQTWTDVPLKAFLAEFAEGLTPDAILLRRTLTTNLSLPDDLTVACDRMSVRRCLENLVHNALRYTPEGSTVSIEAQRVPGAVEVTVRDNGPGVAPRDLPHLFEQFYRGTVSRREPGMGLGLSIVKTILDSHGWAIRAESGPGARFIITIPIEDPIQPLP
jgi:signal transduction histidine kinase